MNGCNRWRATGLALAMLALTLVARAQELAEKQLIRGLVYARVDELELKLDLHLPVKRDGPPLPVVLWFHAGGMMEGGRGFCPIANLAKEGFAVASVSYRLSGQAKFPAQIEDSKAAVRWLRAHAEEYHFDAAHIGACGESAGGMLASLLGVTGDMPHLEGSVGGNLEFSSRVQAVVGLCVPTDLTEMLTKRSERSFWAKLFTTGNFKEAKFTFARAYVMKKLFGGPLPEHADLVRMASAVTHVSTDDPPFLLFHGRKDPLVPLVQGQGLQRALSQAGVESRLIVVETSVHGFGRFPPEMMAETRAFFNRHLR
ncbi:alpha/beta hydrolase [Nibricoccus aquaticus]|nr:alpha/beta hydrolase [Nibricoccus aquaticus]